MKRLLTPRKVLAALVMGLGTTGFGMTAGALHGATTVGRPLDLSARVQFDSPDADEKCLRAEVFYGDTLVPQDQVSVSVHRNDAAPAALVRVVSSRVVDEPVVTVVMRAGCRDTIMRRYVLLADAPGEERQPVRAAAVLGAPAGVATAAPRAAAIDAPVKHARRAERPRAQVRLASSQEPPVARLRLEAAVLPLDRAPWLRVSHELMAQPSADPTQRAAAALLWQAINAQPQDLLRMGDRMHALEREIASLRETSARTRLELDRLGAGAAGPGTPAAAHWLALAGLLALAGAAAGYFGYRTSRARPPQAGAWIEPPLADAAHEAVAAAVPPAMPASNAFSYSPGVDLVLQSETVTRSPRHADLEPLAFDAAQAEAQPAPFALKTTALADALQECEFLVSLDAIEKAVDALRAHVERTPAPCALALLELRALCALAGDDEGVAAVEDDFRARFGEEPPREGASAGLEACEAAMARVTAAWPEPRVLSVIEELLFGPPAALGGFPGVNAWRDLLWLHGLAQDTLRGAAAAAPQAEGHPEMTLEHLQRLDFEPSRNRFAVDLPLREVDLSKHRIVDQQHLPKRPPVPEVNFEVAPAPTEAPRTYEDFFEAVGAAEGRALHVR